MDHYEKLRKIGSGSYGYVYKCRNKDTGQIVAIKKFLETEEDPTIRKITFREIRVLRDLSHPNIVNLLQVFRKKRKLHLVFEFCSSNLLDLMTRHPEGTPPLVARDILHQTLQALNYMHCNLYLHRDVKPENILLQGKTVKLCDLGFARPVNKPDASDFQKKSLPELYTDYVATRWYRSPELLVGEPLYGTAVDVWAIGCVYAECMTGQPLWPGTTDLHQLFLIRKTLGEISLRYQAFFNKNPFYNGASLAPITEPETLENRVGKKIQGDAMNVLKQMVTKDASKRPTAEAIMKLPYFQGLPYTVPLEEMRQPKQKQIFAVFKAFAEEEINHILTGSNTTEIDGLKRCQTDNPKKDQQDWMEMRKRIVKVLNSVAVKDNLSKHSLSGPLPPGLHNLLSQRQMANVSTPNANLG